MKQLTTILIAIISLSYHAQDPQFSQFYAAPNYLNPAFAGAGFQNRIVANYRNQWPSVPKAFVSTNLAADINLAKIKSGLGVLFTNDKAGTGGLKFTNVALQFSHYFKLKRTLFLRPAMQYAVTSRSLDYQALTFGDQLIRNHASTSVEQSRYQKITYFDFSAGALLYNPDRWLGISAHHINQPNESLLQGEAPLPLKLSVHGGMRFELSKLKLRVATKDIIKVAFNYKAQGKFDQFDVGFYYEHLPLVIGIWYRGIPGLKAYQPGYQNNDAIVLLLGAEFKNIKVGYSYDITISRLTTNTAGAHEISLTYQWARKDAPPLSKMKRAVECAKF